MDELSSFSVSLNDKASNDKLYARNNNNDNKKKNSKYKISFIFWFKFRFLGTVLGVLDSVFFSRLTMVANIFTQSSPPPPQPPTIEKLPTALL